MKKTLKFSIISLIVFLAFCGLFLFSMPCMINNVDAEITKSSATISIGSPEDLQAFINGYSENASDCKVLLTKDIDMSGYSVENTIGTSEIPFTGVFDGNGHTISNLNIDFSNTAKDYVVPSYLGLFGVTNGATIFDLKISGVTNITVSNSPNILAVGTLVGKAQNTTIENCDINATLNYVDNKNQEGVNEENKGIKTINAGGYVGELVDSTIKNSLYRPDSRNGASNFSLSSIFKRDAKIGGVAGVVQNSTIMFMVSAPRLSVEIASENFTGTTYIGGIFGTISQGNSKVINCVVEPTITINNNYNKTIYSGAIGGYISLPAPYENNISYVYYNSSLMAFGDTTNYNANNNVTSVSDTIISHKAGARDYFESKKWNGLYGDHWDFANTFIIQDNNIDLQAFQGDFAIRVTTSSVSVDDNIIILLDTNEAGELVPATNNELELTSSGYNDTVQIKFKFNANVNAKIGKYYSLSSLTLRSGETKTVASFLEGDNGYRLDTMDDYDRISMSTINDEEETIYIITISGVTNNYTGLYQLNIVANKFVGKFEYRLFAKDETTEIDEGVVQTECYVYNKTGGNQTSRSYTIDDMTYNNSYTIATRADSRSIYEFRGWYLETDDGDIPLSDADEEGGNVFSNSDLSFTFGQKDFALTDNFVVYAKYVDNSCEITFDFDEGIERIVISTNEDAITTTGTTIKVKKQSNVKMELYLKEDYSFDVQRFLDIVSIYKGVCERVDDGSNARYYQFNLDMTQLNDPSFNNVLNLSFETEVEDTTDWTLIWTIVGSLIGGLALIAIIIVVVVIVKRRKGGGGGGRTRKASYKNMYY